MNIRIPLFFIFIIAFWGCKKDSSNKSKQNPNPADTSKIVINSNVHIIDSTKLKLNADTTLLSKGTYQYTGDVAALGYKINDVIVGQTNGGYIRKITAISISGSSLTLTTVQGNMSDVFENGTLIFNLSTDGLEPLSIQKTINSTNSNLTIDDLSGTIFAKGALSVSGSLSFNPNFIDTVQYANGKLSYFRLGFDNATLTGNLKLLINGSQGTKIDGTEPIGTPHITYKVFEVGIVPVVVKITYSLSAKYSIEVKNTITREVDLTNTNAVSLSVNYINGEYTYIHSLEPNINITIPPFSDEASLDVQFSLVPNISFEFDNVGGPSVSLGFNSSLGGTLASPSLDWDFSAAGWLTGTLDAQASAFGYSVSGNVGSFTSDSITYKTPYTITNFSGDKQTADVNTKLPLPIKILISDSQNKPQPHVPVYFKITSGGGKLDSAKTFTDKNGYAQTNWTLGEASGKQTVDVEAKHGDESLVQNAPVTFTANDTIKIGDRAFGGIVFYVDGTGKHGKVIDTVDLGINLSFPNLPNGGTAGETPYSNVYAGNFNFSNSLDSGMVLTEAIIAGNTTYKATASACINYQGGGYSDWFLPDFWELTLLYKAKNKIFPPIIEKLWSSSVAGPHGQTFTPYYGPFYLNINDETVGSAIFSGITEIANVRAIRDF